VAAPHLLIAGDSLETTLLVHCARESISSMSTVKDQTKKKRLSLQLDRRNAYGENDKASRKSIPRGKQRRHMNERRSVAQVLRPISGNPSEDDAADAELLTKVTITISERKGFKKRPDEPLGAMLAKKKAGKPKWSSLTN
jgi:hypothetical protein